MHRFSPAARFWGGLVFYILAADCVLWRRQHATMSDQFGKWIQTRRGSYLCGAIWGGITTHLFWSVPIPGQARLKKVALYKRKVGDCSVEDLTALISSGLVEVVDPP